MNLLKQHRACLSCRQVVLIQGVLLTVADSFARSLKTVCSGDIPLFCPLSNLFSRNATALSLFAVDVKLTRGMLSFTLPHLVRMDS